MFYLFMNFVGCDQQNEEPQVEKDTTQESAQVNQDGEKEETTESDDTEDSENSESETSENDTTEVPSSEPYEEGTDTATPSEREQAPLEIIGYYVQDLSLIHI